MKSELEQIFDLVRACGQFIKDADRSQLHVDAKGGHANFVTEYDKQVQERLRVGLREIMPDAHFVGEEGTTQAFAPTGKFFIVDPIDGTTNFIKDYHCSSISVALVVDGAAEIGVVYNPYHDQLFDAVKGGGSRLNGKPIHVSDRPFDQSMLITALCLYHKEHAETCSAIIREAYQKCNDVRRFGSCAIELCYLACGLCELYFEYRIMPWDYAAAYLVLTEAGGVLTGRAGARLHFDGPTILVGANNLENHQILSDIVSRHTA